MGWLIAYGIGACVAAVMVYLAIEGDWDRLHWGRAVAAVVAWPFVMPVLLVLGALSERDQ